MLTPIRIISLLGLLLFGSAFALAVLAPKQVETAAKAYIVSEAKAEVTRYFETPVGRTLAETYAALQERYGQEIEDTEAAIKAKLHERIAEALGQLCHFDCETKESLKTALLEGMKSSIDRLEVMLAKVKRLAQDKYSETTAKIRRDLMIFTGANSVVFAFILLIGFLRPSQQRALALPACLMLFATVASSGIYVFGQDWFWVVLTDSYMGYGYLGYVAVIFFFLCDIVYNQGQITLAVIEGILRAVSSFLSACTPG